MRLVEGAPVALLLGLTLLLALVGLSQVVVELGSTLLGVVEVRLHLNQNL